MVLRAVSEREIRESREDGGRASEATGDEEQSDEDRLADSSYYYSKSANILTDGERDQIFSLASIQPGNPAFVAVLLKTHVGHKNNMLVSSYISVYLFLCYLKLHTNFCSVAI